MNQNYAIANTMTALDMKRIRKKLGYTQKELAEFLGCSKPTVERWERSEKEIKGPVAVLLNLLLEKDGILDELAVPEQTYPLRLWYMYRSQKCTLIEVDEMKEAVLIKNYTTDRMFQAFGANENPTYIDYQEFLESRCFPRERDKMKLILKDLDLPFYDPYMIIKKTEGRMAEDDFWIDVEG